MYVNVVIDNKSEYTDRFYTYRAPEDARAGDKVRLPFAGRKKEAEGYIVETAVTPEIPEDKIKDLTEIDRRRALSAEMIETALWMRSRYGCKYIDGIKLFTVQGKRERRTPELHREAGAEAGMAAPALSEEQAAVTARIQAALRAQEMKAFLLFGVTNSGKTEVYMRAAAETLRRGQSAIILVPEIALAAQTEARFRARFGDEVVAVMHSRLKTSERLDQWLAVREGRARIIIGARTAVFAPAEDIGLIVLDEEHETTYKSDHNPKYETVDVAYKRAAQHGAVLLLGSATPSIASYHRAEQGIYELLEMHQRIGASRMPVPEIVDMRKERRAGNPSRLSRALFAAAEDTLARDEQVILFLNRRGFSTQILCPDCGYRMSCPDCDIPLTYHKREHAALCHYCGRSFPVPDACPDCGERHLQFVGAGTERIEESIRALLPEAVVDRFDLDTAGSQHEIDRILRRFQTGETDILVGTQILAKGLDFRNVGLVGVISADSTLNIPDYRSAERTYQLITQVAGRAGRGEGQSRLILQTYEPEDPTVLAAAAGDYLGFYRIESRHRNTMHYPPYSDIIAVAFRDKKAGQAPSVTMEQARLFRERLIHMQGAPRDAVLFPPREDLQRGGAEQHRVVFLIKAPKGTRSGYVRAYREERERLLRERVPCHIEIDVNPYGTY